jgi:hypothetical protein
MGIVALLALMLMGEGFPSVRMTRLLTTSHTYFVCLYSPPWLCDPGVIGGCCTSGDPYIPCSGESGAAPSKAAKPSHSSSHSPSHSSSPSPKAQIFKNVTVSATDPRITYTPQWNLGSSQCDASQQSKKTVTTNQSLSFNTQGFSGKSIRYPD